MLPLTTVKFSAPAAKVPPVKLRALVPPLVVLLFLKLTLLVPALILLPTVSTPEFKGDDVFAVRDTSPVAVIPELAVKPASAVAVKAPLLTTPKINPVPLPSAICTAPPALKATA